MALGRGREQNETNKLCGDLSLLTTTYLLSRLVTCRALKDQATIEAAADDDILVSELRHRVRSVFTPLKGGGRGESVLHQGCNQSYLIFSRCRPKFAIEYQLSRGVRTSINDGKSIVDSTLVKSWGFPSLIGLI